MTTVDRSPQARSNEELTAHTCGCDHRDLANGGDLAGWMNRRIEFLEDLPYADWQECELELAPHGDRGPLSAEEERRLFRQMNLANWQASRIRERLISSGSNVTGDPRSEWEAEFVRLRERADAIRDKLARSFYKLSFSLAGRFTNRLHSFDDLASEGHFTLLRALTQFNPERGFRFSTYAMHAIQRRLFRFMHQRSRQRQFAMSWNDDAVDDKGRRWTIAYEHRVAAATAAVERLLPQLTPRERYVLRSRFGWGREFEPRTLQSIAEELQVSRERVRQLEQRAIRKLRALADPLDVQIGA